MMQHRFRMPSAVIGLAVALAGLLIPAQPAKAQQQSAIPTSAAPPSAQANTPADDQRKPAAKPEPQASAENSSQGKAEPIGGKENRGLHVRLGTVTVAGGYIHFPHGFSPFYPYGFYPYYPYAFGYAPYFYDPFWGFYSYYPSGYAHGFAYGYDKGQVKLRAVPKQAEVYLNGAYAGTADHVKNMWLDPGVYDLLINAPDKTTFSQRIYVLSGKSLKIQAKFVPVKNEDENQKKEERQQ